MKLGLGILAFLSIVVLVGGWLFIKSFPPTPEEFKRQLDDLSARIEKDPLNAELYRKRGEVHLARSQASGIELYLPVHVDARRQDYVAAGRDFEKAASIDPTSKQYQLLLAGIKVGSSISDLKSLSPMADVGELTGETAFGSERPPRITDWHATALAEKPKLEDVLHWLNVILEQRGDDSQSRLYRGEVQFALSNKAAAYQDLSDAIDAASKKRFDPNDGKNGVVYPDVVAYLYTRAACRMLDHENAPALEDFSRAVKIWPYYADVYVKRAFFFHSAGETAKGIEDLAEAKRQRPNYSEEYDRMIAFFKKGHG